jgi:phosphonate transport system substrate-binding protein
VRPDALRVTSCQAPVAEAFCAAVSGYLGARLGIATEFVRNVPWPERLRRFDAGAIHVCWLCGLPYVWRADRGARVELLAAPVMAAPRYGDRPVYFSDVVVARKSRFAAFGDLRGAAWAYNERTSHSGYNVTRDRLARLGQRRGFFGRAVAAGSHETSLELLLDGAVDAAAIDSTVLDLLKRRDPALTWRVRTLETWGPSPMPPWVASRRVPGELRDAIREALLTMHDDEAGRRALGVGLASRFAAVRDADYGPIREAARVAEAVSL